MDNKVCTGKLPTKERNKTQVILQEYIGKALSRQNALQKAREGFYPHNKR